MYKLTRRQLRQLTRDNQRYGLELSEIPRDDWPPDLHEHLDPDVVPLRVLRSRDFMVLVLVQDEFFTRLSVQRSAWDEGTGRSRDNISWDDLQRLKGEAGFGDECAVELYPPDLNVVNVANIRHLFILPEPPAFMWRDK